MKKNMRILFITPVCPYGHDGGHAARARQTLELLQEKHSVWMFYAPYLPGPANPLDHQMLKDRLLEYPGWIIRVSHMIRRIKGMWRNYKSQPPRPKNLRHADVLAPPFLARLTQRWVRKLSIDAVVIEYVYLSAAFLGLPDSVRKVMDACDEFGCRYERLDPEMSVGWPWFLASLTHEMEAKCLNRADITLAIQYDEAERFRQKGVINCTAMPFVPSLTQSEVSGGRDVKKGKTLVYFGSNWSPNVHGLQWFLKQVWPQVLRGEPDAILNVAGSVCRSLTQVPDGVILHGRVDEIRAFVTSARLFICPVFQGTGFNVKMMEAMAWGMPFVVTPMALRGLPLEESPLFPITDTPEVFAEEVIRLLRSEAACKDLSIQCSEYVKRLSETVRQVMADAVEV